MLKPYIEFNTHTEINREKDTKTLYKLISHAIYGKTMETLRNRNDVKLVNNEKGYLKCTSKPSYMPHKILDNSLVAIHKEKLN